VIITDSDRIDLLNTFYVYHNDTPSRISQDFVNLCDCQIQNYHEAYYHTTIAEDDICLLCGHYVRVENIHTTKLKYKVLPDISTVTYHEPTEFPPTAQWVHENKGRHGRGDMRLKYFEALKELDFDIEKSVKCFKSKSEKSLINFLRMHNIYRTETGFTLELVNPHLSRSKH